MRTFSMLEWNWSDKNPTFGSYRQEECMSCHGFRWWNRSRSNSLQFKHEAFSSSLPYWRLALRPRSMCDLLGWGLVDAQSCLLFPGLKPKTGLVSRTEETRWMVKPIPWWVSCVTILGETSAVEAKGQKDTQQWEHHKFCYQDTVRQIRWQWKPSQSCIVEWPRRWPSEKCFQIKGGRVQHTHIPGM